MEQDMIRRYNQFSLFGTSNGYDVLFPMEMKPFTTDSESHYFIHIGKSTFGHKDAEVPERFRYVYETECIPVTVVMFTHNRTAIACEVIDSMVRNIRYPNLRWCISDDQSCSGHIERLVKQFHLNGIDDVDVVRTTPQTHGLGMSMNNGLNNAWKSSDVVLTTEDDWYIDRELDITKDVQFIQEHENIASIRYGTLFDDEKNAWHLATKEFNDDYRRVCSSKRDKTRFIFNNQIALKHKRIYDAIGYYTPNLRDHINNELELSDKFNTLTNFGNLDNFVVLRPKCLKNNTYQNGYVEHIGEYSTTNHKFKVDGRFKRINDMTTREIPVRQCISRNVGDYASSAVVTFLSKMNTKRVALTSRS